jgi:hypothetical protein
MFRCGCALIVIAIALLVYGFQSVRDAAAFQKVKVMDCDTFVKNPPKDGWYQLKGCVLDVSDASVKTSEKHPDDIDEVYLPVYSTAQLVRKAAQPQGSPNAEKIGLILATHDEAVVKTLHELNALPDDQKKVEEWLEKNHDRVFIPRDLEGMVRAGIHEDSETRQKLAGLTQNAAPNFVVMQDGDKPNMGMGILMLIGGVVIGLGTLAWFVAANRGGE